MARRDWLASKIRTLQAQVHGKELLLGDATKPAEMCAERRAGFTLIKIRRAD